MQGTGRKDVETETRLFFFSENCRELSNILEDHTLKLHSSIIHAATGYRIWMLQIEHFPPSSKGMPEPADKDYSKFTDVRNSDTKK